ncbi:MAG TPA: transporter substrate-binding domain-containing protein [Acetobacteraceae bacterium]|nr:transporter substrate-binding domain-containing protein [Acetobacteraceae bacterium]
MRPLTQGLRAHGRRLRGKAGLSLLLLTSFLALHPARAASGSEAVRPLRLCADPTDLPFSSSQPGTPGLYIELGRALARSLGRPAETVWQLTYFGPRSVRTTLLAGLCDAMIGLPDDPDFMGPKLIFSAPLMRIGYVLATPRSHPATTLEALKGRRIAVQYSTTPHSVVGARDDMTAVTVLEPDQAMQALAQGKVDAAFVWGPVAGYMNRTLFHDAFALTPVSGPGMTWPVSVGFSRRDAALRDQVNAAIPQLRPVIAALLAKYGFPVDASAASASAAPAASPVHLAAASGAAPAQSDAAPSPAAAAAPAVGGAAVGEGHDLFNGTCAHCHGVDAVTTERRINLRLLQHRYQARMDEVFFYTVTHGRPSKGMPNWSGVFSQADFTKILAYLHTIQASE